MVDPFVFVTHSPRLGGAERSLLSLAGELVRRDHRVTVITPGEGPLLEAASARGVDVRVARFRRWAAFGPGPARKAGLLAHQVPGVLALARTLRDIPGLVVSNSASIGAAAVAARLSGRRHATWFREFLNADNSLHPVFGEARSVRALGSLSDLALANSRAVAAWTASHGLQATVVDNPVPTPDAPRRRRTDGALVFGVLGAIVPHKVQVDAVTALAVARRAGHDISLLLAGPAEPAYLSVVERTIAERGVGPHVELLGEVPAPAQLIDRVDVGVVCSQREAFGRVTVEFAKAGRPVIGAASGGTIELITDGETGILYPPGDVDALAQAFGGLAKAPQRVHELGDRALASMAGRFTDAAAADQFLAAAAGLGGADR